MKYSVTYTEHLLQHEFKYPLGTIEEKGSAAYPPVCELMAVLSNEYVLSQTNDITFEVTLERFPDAGIIGEITLEELSV